jgi:hypothetical protein
MDAPWGGVALWRNGGLLSRLLLTLLLLGMDEIICGNDRVRDRFVKEAGDAVRLSDGLLVEPGCIVDEILCRVKQVSLIELMLARGQDADSRSEC